MTNGLIRNLGTLIQKNSPAILTGLSVAGVIMTGWLTHRAAMDARDAVEDYIYERDGSPDFRDHAVTTKEWVDIAWKHYIPPILMGAATIACVIGAHTVSNRRHVALISAYALGERALDELRGKLEPAQDDRIRADIAKDRVLENQPPEVSISDGLSWCYDVLTGRYFPGTVETVRKAMNDTNAETVKRGFASLNMFYEGVGLPTLPLGDSIGFNVDNPLEIVFSEITAEDGRLVWAVDFRHQPKQDYYSIDDWR